MHICIYCGKEAKYQFKNGEWCCSKNKNSCPEMRKRNGDGNRGKKRSKEFGEKISKLMKGKNNHMFGTGGYWKDKKRSKGVIKKFKISHRLKIIEIKERHPFFSQIEELRYNPNKPGEKEIQVHCKNSNCPNSKEKGGWFTPTKSQFYERIRQLKLKGNDGSYLYCSQECKGTCPLYNVKSDDPLKDTKLPYTQAEKDIFNKEVLERQRKEDGYNFCEMCYSTKKLHVHHEKPVKTHPHLALDPDNGIVLCQECHYKYGHKTGTECSTGALANKVLSGCKLNKIYKE